MNFDTGYKEKNAFFKRIAETAAAPVKALSKDEVRLVSALKKQHLEFATIYAEMHREIHFLECKYAKKCDGFFKKRNEIINGIYKPTDEECEFDAGEKATEAESADKKFDNGLENFWLHVLEKSTLMSEYICEYDRPILKHLTDIQIIVIEDPMSFRVDFVFEPNEYFTNKVLSKTYYLKVEVQDDSPADFDGIEFEKCEGTIIDWNEGKNPMITVIKKKQKHKTRGIVRTMSKTMARSSFFSFFKPPQGTEDDLDESQQYLLQCDFDLGHYLKERLIPFAVEYFTGDFSEEEDEDEEEEEEEEDDDDEDLDDEDDYDGDGDGDGDDDDDAAVEGGADGEVKEKAADCKQQ